MKILILLCQLLLASIQTRGADPWTIAPDGKSGSITEKTTEADLRAMYGEPNVRDDKIDLGEGAFESGTVLFPEDPMKRIELLWTDAEGKRFPKSVFVGGIANGAFIDKSVWHTTFGITLGTTLFDLERINRKPFRLAGFGWDYSGTVLSWDGGALEAIFGSGGSKKVFVRLTNAEPAPPEYRAVLGDRNFSSGHPAMQKINPHVYQMIFAFRAR